MATNRCLLVIALILATPPALYALGFAIVLIRTVEIIPSEHRLSFPFSHRFCIYEAWHASASDGWSLYLLSDPPEGTHIVLSIPCWIISMIGIVALLSVLHAIHKHGSSDLG